MFLLFTHLCLLFAGISFATIYSGVLNYFASRNQVNNIAFLLGIFNYTFFLSPVVLLFIPYYHPRIAFFQKTDPAGFNKRSMLEIINQVFSSIFLLQVIIVAILFLASKPVSLWKAVAWIELLILSAIIRLIVQATINLKSRLPILIAVITAAIIITACIICSHLTLPIATLISIVTAVICYHRLQFIYKQ